MFTFSTIEGEVRPILIEALESDASRALALRAIKRAVVIALGISHAIAVAK